LRRVQIKEISSVVSKGTTPTTHGHSYKEFGIPLLRVNNIDSGKFDLEDVKYIDEKAHADLKRSQLVKGDLIISIAGSIGKTAIVEESILPANCNQALAFVRLEKEKVDIRYAQHWLNSDDAISQITKNKVTATISNLSLTQIKNLEIPLPSLSEQKAIVAKLDRAQRLIDIDREMLAKYDELIQSVFLEMFGDDLKEKRNTKTLKEVTKFIDYRGQSPDKAESGIPLITAKNVKEGYLNEDPKEYMNVNSFEDWMTRGVPNPGDVLFTTEAPLGNVCIIPNLEKFAIAQRLICFQLGKGVIAEYLMYYLLSDFAKFELDKRATGSTAKGIGSARLKKVPVVIPELKKQKSFKTIYQKIIREKLKIEKSLNKSEELFSSLVQGVFG